MNKNDLFLLIKIAISRLVLGIALFMFIIIVMVIVTALIEVFFIDPNQNVYDNIQWNV